MNSPGLTWARSLSAKPRDAIAQRTAANVRFAPKAAHSVKNYAAVDQRFHSGRPQRQRLVKAGERLGQPAGLCQRHGLVAQQVSKGDWLLKQGSRQDFSADQTGSFDTKRFNSLLDTHWR